MKLKLIVLLSSLVLSPLALTAAETTPPPAPEASENARPGGRRGEMRAELKHLAEALNLTETQKDQVREILKERAKAVRDLSKEERRGEPGKKIREESRQKIRALLTPEQQAKFDQIAAEWKGKYGKGPKGPKPDAN